MKIVLMGPPGAGKGTQAKSISLRYSIPHISTGDIFRKNISNNTELGLKAKSFIENGDLVPDEITIALLLDRLSQEDCLDGFLLDGFPRSIGQAKALDKYLLERKQHLDAVLLITVPSEFILDRMTGRRSCISCGASYHIRYNPPFTSGKCDICGCDIIQRKDDTEEVLRERLEVYQSQTRPLIDYYKSMSILKEVDGTQSINAVFENMTRILGSAYNK
ncbi:adenylate kinase [Clostridium thermarum]|uniref:adenylate kinase n=1 Tax=Clostridium thermarum TaxID=1716543 RepID=UPI0013D7C0DB|nr:adenylate kinase [Clostridium thermarum]